MANAAALSVRHVRNKLQTLPTTLSDTYDEAMQRIQNQEPDRKEVALKTLAWVSYAFRSLSLRELQHAVAIKPGDTYLDEELVMDGSSITALCAGLVIVDQRSSLVNLVHYTTKHYFEQNRSVTFPNFHATITMSCATYLTLDMLKDIEIWKILRDFPLAGYAAQYMADHARENPEESLEPSVLETICQLLSHPAKRRPLLALLDSLDIVRSGFYPADEVALSSQQDATLDQDVGSQLETLVENMMQISDNGSHAVTETEESNAVYLETQVEASRIPEVTALHLAASMGLAKVAAMLLKETPNIDAVDETGNTALTMAIDKGFEKAVEFLITSGACVDLRHTHGRQILLLATERDWNTVGEVIAQRAELITLEEQSSTTQDQVQLLLATYHGDDKAVRQLIDQASTDLKEKDRDIGISALLIAVERGHLEIVDHLLMAGINIDSRDSTGQTSLHRVTRRKSEMAMKHLLKRGATVDLMDDTGRTAFSANARSCGDFYLKILLDAGADPNTKGHDGISELYQAAAENEVDYVKVLLRCGTDPSIKTRYGWTPLHWAANNGHIEVVKLLIEAGAALSPLSDQNSTPLDMALRANQFVIVDLLTRAGAKENADALSTCDTITPTEALEELKSSGHLIDIYSVPNLIPVDNSSPPNKLSLVFDKPLGEGLVFGQFVYPSNFPGTRNYYYHISHPLDAPVTSISIRSTNRRADMADYPIGVEKFFPTNILHELIRFATDYQELELRARSHTALYDVVKMQRVWTGNWKAHREGEGTLELLFRTTPDWSKGEDDGNQWITDDGTLLAKSGDCSGAPILTFECGLERHMQDLLVACWVAKLWSEKVTVRKNRRT